MLQRLPGWECIRSQAEGPRLATVTQPVLATIIHPSAGHHHPPNAGQHHPPNTGYHHPPNVGHHPSPTVGHCHHLTLATVPPSVLTTITHLTRRASPHSVLATVTYPALDTILCSVLATVTHPALATITNPNLTIVTHPAPQHPSFPVYPMGAGTTSTGAQQSQPGKCVAEPEPKYGFHPKTALGLGSSGKTSDLETLGCSFDSHRPGKLQSWEWEW